MRSPQTTRTIPCLVAAAAVLLMLLPASTFGGVSYNIVPLTGIGNYATTATAINNAGDVVGNAFTGQIHDPGDWNQRIYNAFLWHNGQGTNLHDGARLDTRAADINNAGQILITGSDLMWSLREPLTQIYAGGAYESIDAPWASRINARGQVAGSGYYGSFVWQNGQKNDLSFVGTGWQDVRISAINDNGWLVGRGVTDTSGGWGRAFLQIPGSPPQDLGALGCSWASSTDVNNQGMVVGSSWFGPQQSSTHAFLWTIHDGMQDLGTLGGETTATAINENGLVVGTSNLEPSSSYLSHAFLYRDGELLDLNSLIDPLSGWELTSAADINDLGQIVGTGLFNGEQRAFVLTPVPEPASTALLLLATLTTLRRRR